MIWKGFKRYPGQVPESDHAMDVAWEAGVRKALMESQERLIKQRQGLKDLLGEALDIMSREPGLPLETRQRIADWAHRCDKAFREFGS
jgi:hypothetical protein